MRTISIAFLAGAVLAIGAGSTSAASSCGTVNGGFENTIKATGVSCTNARALVRRWHKKAVGEARGPYGVRYVGTYACHSYETDPEHVKVYCADHTKKISFFAGP